MRACIAMALAIAALGSGCKNERTETVVRVWAEPGVIARATVMDVVLRGGEGRDPAAWNETGRERFDLGNDSTTFPIDVAIVPANGDTSRQFELVATLSDRDGAKVATVRAVSGFVDGATKQLDLWFGDGCMGVECPDGETCMDDAMCRDARVDVTRLAELTPRPSGAPLDAGIDAGELDAGPPIVREGGAPRPTCGSPEDCNDGNPCTADDCVATHCFYRPADGESCDDGVRCTGNDVCLEGACVGTVITCEVGLCNRRTGDCDCSPGAPGCAGR